MIHKLEGKDRRRETTTKKCRRGLFERLPKKLQASTWKDIGGLPQEVNRPAQYKNPSLVAFLGNV